MTVTVKTVSVHYERKLNLGDYNSAAIGCDLWADVSDDQDLDAAMTALWEMAKANVKAQLLPLTAKQKAEVEQIFMGLPLELRPSVEDQDEDEDGREWDMVEDDSRRVGEPGHPLNYGDR